MNAFGLYSSNSLLRFFSASEKTKGLSAFICLASASELCQAETLSVGRTRSWKVSQSDVLDNRDSQVCKAILRVGCFLQFSGVSNAANLGSTTETLCFSLREHGKNPCSLLNW